MAKKTPMTKADIARIQSGAAKNGTDTSKKSFPARAQSTADKNLNKGVK
ncbi:hypothetical protein [Sulfurimonas sp.]|nr:hypothetical protein [Sulfurimonas sp.]